MDAPARPPRPKARPALLKRFALAYPTYEEAIAAQQAHERALREARKARKSAVAAGAPMQSPFTAPVVEETTSPIADQPAATEPVEKLADRWSRVRNTSHYIPTPEEIELAKAEIQAGWSDEDRIARVRGWGYGGAREAEGDGYVVPEVSLGTLE